MQDGFGFAPDPENAGWFVRPVSGDGRFIDMFGAIRVRAESDRIARVRIGIERRHLNVHDKAHGGFLLALVDQALFVGPAALGVSGAVGGVTIDAATQFLAPVAGGEPIDAVIEVLRETGHMVFMRGLIEQGGVAALAFSGTIRKASRRAQP